jgi:molybdenum cofactor biosynthesis enzyme MoaA
MKKIIQIKSDRKSTHLRIEYMVGNYCNYKCWYCGPHANGGTHRWSNNTDLLYKNMSHLLNYFIKNGKNTFELNYVGGEPTLWPDIASFTRKIKENFKCEVSLTTNGSRTLRWWEENAKAFDKIRFSCHPGHVDIDHYIKVCDLVFEQDVGMNALILMDPTNWDESIRLIEECKKSKHPWFVNAMEVFSQHSYTEEQKKYISKVIKRRPSLWWILRHDSVFAPSPKVVYEDGSEEEIERNFLSLNGLNSFRGWQCNLGLDNINIQKDGILTGTCSMKLYGEDSFYNIYDEDFVEKFNPKLIPITCERDWCWCQPEQLLDKKLV